MHSVALFDDGRGLLSPLTDLRPVFDVRTGAMTTLERAACVARHSGTPAPTHLMVPDRLVALTRARHALPVNERSSLGDTVTLLNGAAPLAAHHASAARDVGFAVVDRAGTIIAATVPTANVEHVLRHDTSGLRVTTLDHEATLSRPWHIRRHRDESLRFDLHCHMAAALGMATKDLSTFEFRTSIAPSARVHPSVIFDTEHGHVYIDEHAVIRPGAILVGPVYIGPHSTVLERALIKSGTAIGPHCKVAGEISGTIFQGFANKAHDGHLGDSYIGEWANLGAGTTNSNLLNTYGDVVCRPLPLGTATLRVAPNQASPTVPPLPSNERTGQQFLGATIGDHVKTAICTRIMTGAIVGTGTMYAATPALSGTIPAFSWITDAGTKTFAPDKFMEIARTVMARRKISCGKAYEDALRALMGKA